MRVFQKRGSSFFFFFFVWIYSTVPIPLGDGDLLTGPQWMRDIPDKVFRVFILSSKGQEERSCPGHIFMSSFCDWEEGMVSYLETDEVLSTDNTGATSVRSEVPKVPRSISPNPEDS